MLDFAEATYEGDILAVVQENLVVLDVVFET